MPRTKRKAVARKNIRIPKPIIDEVDRIVRGSGVYLNRQQFIESALRERIEQSRLAEKIGGDFTARIKDTFLAHAIIDTIKEETLPAHHLDPKQFEQYIRGFVEERAEREGRGITKERLDELTKDLLEYYKELLEGLSLMASHKRARRADFPGEPLS